MIPYLVAFLAVAALLAWLWNANRDPAICLVPPALAFSPLVRYAGEALGWPGAWLSARKALVFVLGLSLAFRFLKADYTWRRIPGMAVIAPYLCLVLLSVLWSVLGPYNADAPAILDEFVDWALPVALFLYFAASPTSERTIASAERVMAFTVFTVAAYCALQLLVLIGHDSVVPNSVIELTHEGEKDFWWGSFRLYGPFASLGPNALGVFLLLPVAHAMIRCADTSGAARLGWAFVSLIAIAVIVGSYSRGAELGLLGIGLTLPLVRQSIRGFGFVALVLVGMVTLLGGTAIGQHVRAIYSAGQLDPDVAGRLAIWREILSELPDHLLGFGFDGWSRASQHLIVVTGDPLIHVGAPFPADSQWIRELADRGMPGILLLAVIMAGLIALVIRRARHQQASSHSHSFLTAAGAGLVGWSFTLFSGDNLALTVLAGMFWYVAGIALAAARDSSGSSGGVQRMSGSPLGPAQPGAVDRVAPQLHISPAIEEHR